MYNKVDCITITCDNCGGIFQDAFTDFSIFIDKETARDHAVNNNEWLEEKEKHYCPKCYRIDDDDNVTIIPKQA